MKTGILTYHNTRNCGAVLQAYALQKTLFSLGIDNEIIDYRCRKIDDAYRLKHFGENRTAKELAKWALTIKNNKNAQKKFDAFKRDALQLSTVYDRATIHRANERFDAFITGSDQVWNFYLNGGDYTYLLDFAAEGKKKISYAASMGSAAAKKSDEAQIKKELLTFDAVSVREKPLQAYIRQTMGISPALVLDPTLLLGKEDYDFPSDWKKPAGSYIFVYTIAPTPHIDGAARALSEKTGYPVIWGHMSYRKKKGVQNATGLSPAAFVRYIKNAAYVLTSSFHGMAFSIIMEKQFFYDLDVNKQNNNARLETLSALLDLQGRELKNTDTQTAPPIDYSIVGKKLDKWRQASIAFLKDSLTKRTVGGNF